MNRLSKNLWYNLEIVIKISITAKPLQWIKKKGTKKAP